jgi:hypothetical protein
VESLAVGKFVDDPRVVTPERELLLELEINGAIEKLKISGGISPKSGLFDNTTSSF